MIKKVLCGLAAFCSVMVFTPIAGFCQDKGSGDVYSLEDCIRIALKENTTVRSSRAQIPAADAAVENAFGAYLPSLDAAMGYTRQLNPMDEKLYPCRYQIR
jgi:hypothetical protein